MAKKSKDNLTVTVTLRGLTPLLFDRYAGDNKTQLRPDQKMYLHSDGRMYLPALNLLSLLTAQNTSSAPKRFLDSRKYKAVAQAIQSYTSISPAEIPLTRDGKPIVFSGFGADETCETSGVSVRRDVARLDKGVPNPKERPMLALPWMLEFDLMYFRNDEVQLETVQNLLVKGGMAIGIGTFRGVFGKFALDGWKIK